MVLVLMLVRMNILNLVVVGTGADATVWIMRECGGVQFILLIVVHLGQWYLWHLWQRLGLE